MSQTPTSRRLLWADIMRISAIAFVVMVHTFSLSSERTLANITSVIFFLLAKTGVPLFVMVSGALLIPKHETPAVFFRKRIRRVLLPWTVWTVIMQTTINPQSLLLPVQFFREAMRVFSAQFSFLPMIFCLYLLIPIFRILAAHATRKQLLYAVFLWFFGVSVLPFWKNSLAFPLFVDNGLVRQTIDYSGYALLGFLLATQRLPKKSAWLFGIFGAAVIAWLFTLVMRPYEVAIIYLSYVSPWIVMLSVSIFLLIRSLFPLGKTPSKAFAHLVSVLSAASFGVFLIHGLVIREIQTFLSQISENNGIFFVTTFVVSLSVILILQHAPIVCKVRWG